MLCASLTAITAVNTFTFFGIATYCHFYFLLFALTPILVWRMNQLLPIVFYFSVNVFLFIIAQFFLNQSQYPVLFTKTEAELISIFTVVATCLSLLTVLWISKNQIEENEKLLSHQSNKLIDMVEELNLQQSEILNQKQMVEDLNQTLSDKNQILTNLVSTKDKFFSIISHDLKNPFNTILGFSNMLVLRFDKLHANDIKKYAEIIQMSAQQVYSLLENLLEWSKTQTGNIIFNPAEISLDSLLEETISLSKIFAENKNIQLDCHYNKSIVVFVDKEMIKTTLRNLLSNAIKFSYRNSTIEIRVSEQNSNLLFEIKDSGVGIEKELLSEIFKTTSNNVKEGTENEKGSGIGLSLCKEFVEKHGGQLWVESKLGEGSTFAFTIKKM